MKKIIALIAAALTLGVAAPSEVQAGHRYYSRGCNSGAAVVQSLLYLAASNGGYGYYHRPSYGYVHYGCRPRYSHYPRYRSYGYRNYGYRSSGYRNYGYRSYGSRRGYGCRRY